MSKPASTPRPSHWTHFRRPLYLWTAATVGVMVLLVGLGTWLALRCGPSTRSVTVAVAGSSAPSANPQDERLRRLALGTWQDSYQGKRTLILRADGSATIIVELSGIKARLFTPRLELDIVWSIEDGKMHRRTVGGRPADKVEFVNQHAGVAVAEPVLSLTAGQMILLDQDGSRRYTWQRAR